MKRMLWLGLALALSMTACQDVLCLADPDEEHLCELPAEETQERIVLEGPVAWSAGVAFYDTATSRVTLLRTNNASAAISHVDVPENPSRMLSTPDKDALVILSSTSRTLTVLRPDEPGAREDYDLGSPFDTLKISEDGRFVIAYFDPFGQSEQIISNRNEMAIIDLFAEKSEGNPQRLSLRSLGSRPLDVQFAPSFMLNGQERRLALILAENYVHILELDGFDADNPNLNETIVRFVQDTSDLRLTTRQVLWTEDDPVDDSDMFAFLLTNGSDDIISLNLLPSEETDALGRPRVRPSLNQLTGGRGPVQIDLFTNSEGKRKLLAVNAGTRDLAVIDVATSDTTLIPLEDAMDSIRVYQALNRNSDRVEPYAVLYNSSGRSRNLLFAELETLEVRRTRALDRLTLDRGVAGLRMTPSASGIPRALLLHESQASFSLLNLERASVTPLDAVSSVSAFTFLDEEMMVVSLQARPWISLVELATGHPQPIRLDEPATSLTVIAETNTLLVTHDDNLGQATLLPLDEPVRENARMLHSFGANGLLDVTYE